MKSIDGRNNVKIYNLSAGKALPDWLTERKRRKLAKRDVDIRRRIELIQDFTMPDVSTNIKVSPDGQYILASGTYKPRVKCFEVSALSLKFERCFDAEVVEFEVLSEDYSKIVFLQEERYIEFHNQGGRWFRTRIPKFGRDLAYHYPSCDLYIATSGSEIYRLNLHEGKFLNSLQTSSPSINKCVFNPIHYLLTCGTEDGRIEMWDPRARHRVGVLDCALHMIKENVRAPTYRSAKEFGITSLAYDGALTLGVGTQTGQILLYDLRSPTPLLSKDHFDSLPITDLEFHSKTKSVLSLSPAILKIWDKDTGTPHTSIESDVRFNDVCSIPDSGMIFLTTEDTKMQIYFLPSMGPAPKWCGHLDALIEELEEEEIGPAFDDYKFVLESELVQLGLDNLIGTNVLRAVMHGYYIDVRLYNKAKMAANIPDAEKILKKKVKEKISEQNERKIVHPKKITPKADPLTSGPTLGPSGLPPVNPEPYLKLREEAKDASGDGSSVARDLLSDGRFRGIFSRKEFSVDKEAEVYSLIQPFSGKMDQRFKQMEHSSEDEEDDAQSTQVGTSAIAEPDHSDSESDSIVSASEEEKEEEEREEEGNTKEEEEMEEEEEDMEEGQEVENDGVRGSSSKSGFLGALRERGPQGKKGASRTSQFTSVDTVEELRSDGTYKGMSLSARLEEAAEDEKGIVIKDGATLGSREMKFTVGKKMSDKFERLRREQREHHAERKKGVRKTNKIKGKIRMNKPFAKSRPNEVNDSELYLAG